MCLSTRTYSSELPGRLTLFFEVTEDIPFATASSRKGVCVWVGVIIIFFYMNPPKPWPITKISSISHIIRYSTRRTHFCRFGARLIVSIHKYTHFLCFVFNLSRSIGYLLRSNPPHGYVHISTITILSSFAVPKGRGAPVMNRGRASRQAC